MLKKICGLFLGLVVCAGSACVTPTHASSAIGLGSVIITQIQASGEFGAKDEYIVIHNNSNTELAITNWCLMNKSGVLFSCFENQYGNVVEEYILPPYSDAVVVSTDHANARSLSGSAYTVIFDVTNQSSGSIVNSSDSISLLNDQGEEIDIKAWDSAIPTNKVLSRILLLLGPDIYANTNSTADWLFQNRSAPPVSAVEIITLENPSLNPEVDPTPDPAPELAEPSLEDDKFPPIITEILANPAGSDTSAEFIELYNPNEEAIVLDDFALVIGLSSPKIHNFPAGTIISPLTYLAFSNQDMGYTLVNTNGRVQLTKNGQAVGGAIEYVSPKDDFAWALIEGTWQYIKPATPSAPNTISINTLIEKSSSSSNTSEPKPCAPNQFRNPETGRCKLISAAVSTPAPCKEGQERNPETNRCRNIVVATTPAPCKEGQERNPETNRCRNIVKMSKAEHGISVDSKSDAAMSWYYWVAIGAILLLILGYAVWEWREELIKLWLRLKAKFAKHPD